MFRSRRSDNGQQLKLDPVLSCSKSYLLTRLQLVRYIKAEDFAAASDEGALRLLADSDASERISPKQLRIRLRFLSRSGERDNGVNVSVAELMRLPPEVLFFGISFSFLFSFLFI